MSSPFTLEQLESALTILVSISNGTIHVNPSYGLCHALTYPRGTRSDLSGDHIVGHYAYTWEEYSGDSEFPVRSYDNNRTCEDQYILTKDLWDKNTEYGRARWRLVDYLINRVSADLQQMSA